MKNFSSTSLHIRKVPKLEEREECYLDEEGDLVIHIDKCTVFIEKDVFSDLSFLFETLVQEKNNE